MLHMLSQSRSNNYSLLKPDIKAVRPESNKAVLGTVPSPAASTRHETPVTSKKLHANLYAATQENMYRAHKVHHDFMAAANL